MSSADTASIAPATLSDMAAIKDLLTTSGLPTEDLEAKAWANFLVLREGHTVRGAVAVEASGPVGLLRSLVVAADNHRQGDGTRLTIAAEHQASRLGIQRLYLLTTTATGFFAARGYATVERDAVPEAIRQSAQFAGLCPASAPVMMKSLVE